MAHGVLYLTCEVFFSFFFLFFNHTPYICFSFYLRDFRAFRAAELYDLVGS